MNFLKSYNYLIEIYNKQISFFKNYLSDLLLLSIRVWIGLIFLKASLVKIADFDTQIILFTYEYAIPFFSPTLMAFLATFFELVCSILIFAGFLTRLSTLPFIAMTIVIQTLVIEHNDHFYWLFLLLTLTIYGAGRLSIDYLLTNLLKKNDRK